MSPEELERVVAKATPITEEQYTALIAALAQDPDAAAQVLAVVEEGAESDVPVCRTVAFNRRTGAALGRIFRPSQRIAVSQVWLRDVVTTAIRPRERRDTSGRSSSGGGDPGSDSDEGEPSPPKGATA